MAINTSLDLFAQPFLSEPFQTRLVRWSTRMFVDERSIDTQWMPDFECGQVTFEGMTKKDSMRSDQWGWAGDQCALDGGQGVFCRG